MQVLGNNNELFEGNEDDEMGLAIEPEVSQNHGKITAS